MKSKTISQSFLIIFLLTSIFSTQVFYGQISNTKFSKTAEAATITEIKKNIDEKNSQIANLNDEIKKLDEQIQQVSKEKQTLQTTVKNLDISSNKLSKELDVTKSKISTTNLTIEQLKIEIAKKESEINEGLGTVAKSLRKIEQLDSSSLVEMVLTNDNLANIWNEVVNLEQFQDGVRKNVKNLEGLKVELADKHSETTAQKNNLLGLQSELDDQKRVIDITKKDKDTLLTQTKNQESAYVRQLEEKKRLAEEFTRELNSYENQLKLIIDPNSYPSSGKGILAWPVDSVFITQKFGNTDFARTGAYNGHGHNGIDFRAPTGTKIKSALGGVVEGVGNTDSVKGCFSYGKWVLVRHDNGLSTLYAHLSLISVSAGQRLKTGDIVGYSGSTGYSTGPHLHFGVYATQGVKILKYENSINCKNAIIPVADLRAYLDPLVYL